jgi:hypothetical protein
MRTRLVLVALCFLVACGGGAKKSATSATEPPPAGEPIPKTAGPACAAVADQLAIVVHADHAPDQQSAETAKTAATLRTQCETDKWSDEARNCLGSVQSQSELDGCTKLLSEPQRKAFASSSEPSRDAAPVMQAAPPPKPKATTRGAVKKDKPKPKQGESDPDDGGE